tara:strand:+ start:427 stop:921 length:495 start_codon:yes stop_codon:yes gene_type:complete
MAETKTYGLKIIKSADPEASGDMPAVLTELCKTYKNSCEFVEDDPTITEENSDQQDDPIHVFVEKGGRTVKLSTYDNSNELLLKLKGGSILNGQWLEPTAQAPIYQAVEITMDSGIPLAFPKCLVSAKFNWKMVKNGLALLEITLKPLSPAENKPAVIWGIKTV